MEESEVKAEKEDALAKYTRQLAKYTLWLMLATTVAMAAAVWTAYSTKELRDFAAQQAEDMKKSLEMTRNGIFVGNRQAKAAEDANEQARRAAKNQLRAYVVQQAIDTNDVLTTSQTSFIHLKNVGVTPAINMAFRVATAVVKKIDNVSPPSPYDVTRDQSAPVEVLGAGIDTDERVIRPSYSEDEIASLRSKNSLLIIWGVVWYDDILGEPHHTRFCKYFKEADFRHWNLCLSHNDAS